MTVFNWGIANLEREVADGYVYIVHYTIDAKDEAYSAGAYGSIGLEKTDNLIPYSDLTKELVIGWVKEKLGNEKVAEVEAALQSQIDEQRTPTRLPGVPW